MKILTQNLKTGNTEILEVPSPQKNEDKIIVQNQCSLISTGTESYVVNFGKAGWINKARQQPDKVKDVINKIKSSGFNETFRAIKRKLDYPMVMGYSAVGTVAHANEKFFLSKGDRVFTNSVHQEQALIDYNMCVKIPDEVDNKSASFGAIGGIAIQSIKCIPQNSKRIALIGLGLLGQVTSRILIALGYECIVYDIDKSKVQLAEKIGAKGVHNSNLAEEVLELTNGVGADCTIIAASSLSNEIINDATSYTKRKGKIISSGLVGLNLIRDKFFQKQIELVVSNSSGDKNHRGEGSSFQNITYFFELLVQNKIKVSDLISEETSLNEPSKIYSFPTDSLFFSKLINYDFNNINQSDTIFDKKFIKNSNAVKAGVIGSGNFSLSTLLPVINKNRIGYVNSILGREGLPLFIAKKRFNINKITTNSSEFFKDIDAVFISTPHETHYDLLKKSIDLSIPTWIEKPLVISIDELLDIKERMLATKINYALGFNRSFAPWTNYAIKEIKCEQTDIMMRINAGKLPENHWLLNQKKCGGRIVGEFCHFIDLSLTLLSHTKIQNVECVKRDAHYQDTGNYILNFEDGSKVNIDYRYDLPPSMPKENIIINLSNKTLKNNNWRKFSNNIFDFNFISKGKGHDEAVQSFFERIQSNNFSTKDEINQFCLTTFISLKLQNMSQGETVDINQLYNSQILSQ
tara:strand:- start:5200 stop:7272 length:2073 start_codon:yes stop_codon:yes gene_type:complete